MGDSENLRDPDSSEALSTEPLQLNKALLGHLGQGVTAGLPPGKTAMSPHPVPFSGSGLMEKSQSGTGGVPPRAEHRAPQLVSFQMSLGFIWS